MRYRPDKHHLPIYDRSGILLVNKPKDWTSSDNGFFEADELFLLAPHQMRRGKMHPLRQVHQGLPNGCGSQPQYAKPKERHRVHSLPKMQESLSC